MPRGIPPLHKNRPQEVSRGRLRAKQPCRRRRTGAETPFSAKRKRGGRDGSFPAGGRSKPLTARCAVLTFSRKNDRSEEHTSELQSRFDLVCRLLLEKKKGRI